MGRWMILVNKGFEANSHFLAKLWWQATRSESVSEQLRYKKTKPGNARLGLIRKD
jgi:hypothetical protein